MPATVDIITRTKDRPLFLGRMLDSVLAQTFRDWRIVLVNSGDRAPVDVAFRERSGELAGRYTIVEAEGETRLGALLNIGARATDSKYVVVLDDDDTWLPGFLERTVGVLEDPFHPAVGGCITRTWVIEEEVVDGEIRKIREYGLDDDLRNLSIFKLAGMNRFSPNSFVYLREAYEKVGYFDESLPVLEDWDFNLRFLLEYEIQVAEDFLALYHLRPQIGEGDASNTQFHSGDKHRFFETLIINQKLRKEIAANEVGLGFVMSHSHAIRDLNDKFRRLQSKLESVSDKVGKVNSRTRLIKDETVRVLGRNAKSRSRQANRSMARNPKGGVSLWLVGALALGLIGLGALLKGWAGPGLSEDPGEVRAEVETGEQR